MGNKYLLMAVFFLLGSNAMAQFSGAFTVGGDLDKFYPVTFLDYGWDVHAVSELEVSRSNTHENAGSRGGLISRFRYHTTQWGHGANFIEGEVHQVKNAIHNDFPFIAGWKDATISNGSFEIIIWLRGGNTTYHYKSLYANTAKVYDGAANALPFQEENGPAHSYKTTVDPYVNSSGINATTAYFSGERNNYFNGNVGIGVYDTKGYKLAVAGSMIAESVKVKLQGGWPDYVFEKSYHLPTLQQTETHIKEKGHLPGIPSAVEVKEKGIDLGEMNAKLLQKIEELTLHLIEQNKQLTDQRKDRQTDQALLHLLQKQVSLLEQRLAIKNKP